MEKFGRLTTIAIFALIAFFCVAYVAIEVLNQRRTTAPVPKDNIHFRIDASFSPDRIEKIYTAIRKWEASSGGCLKIQSQVSEIPISDIASWSADGIPTIYNASRFFSWKRHVASQLCPRNKCLGVAQSYTGDIFLIANSEEIFETVALHEIGHALLGGLHSNVSKDLMYPIIGGPKGISFNESIALQLLYCKYNGEIPKLTEGERNGK
jgi:hypothetical protein